jgi:O-antigen/teichoic acid export membrane protein
MINNLKEKAVRALRWSEQYTKTDMVYLAKGGGWLTFGQILKTLAGLGLTIAFANLLPQETYGSYKYIISLAGIISIFTLTGLRTAVTQAVARGYEGSLEYGFKQMLKWSSGIVIVALGCGAYYYLQGNIEFATAMFFIAVFYPVLKSTELYQNFLEGVQDFKHRTLYISSWEIIQALVIVGTILLTDSLLMVLLAFFAANAITPLFFFWLTKRKHKSNNKVDPDTLPYSKHLSIMNGIRNIAKHIDKVLVFQFLGPLQLAVYSFATLPVEKVRGLLGPISTLALPKFSAAKKDDLLNTLPRKVGLFVIFSLSVVVVVIFALPYLFELLFPAYMEAVAYAQVYTLSFLFYPAILFEQALAGQADEKALYRISAGESIFKIVSIGVLLWLYGIWGGILALVLTEAVKASLNSFYFYKMK